MSALPRPSSSDSAPRRSGEVLLGEDWVVPALDLEPELRDQGGRGRGLLSLNSSPLARKIVVFNLLALVVLTAGILYGNPQRPVLVAQRQAALQVEAQLYARMLATQAGPFLGTVGLRPGPAARVLAGTPLRDGTALHVLDPQGTAVAAVANATPPQVPARETVLVDALERSWAFVLRLEAALGPAELAMLCQAMAARAAQAVLTGDVPVSLSDTTDAGQTLLAAAVPVTVGDRVVGSVAISAVEPAIDLAARSDREQVLRVFIVSLLVSIGLSLLLASTIANPLSDLAAAAELGRSRDARRMAPGRVRIPDLTARPDEIGRLSVAMRGMVAALYDRIDANEQFAADVAHELKNPLASLRSAVGSLQRVRKEEHRIKLLDVIEHDVRRLDRLVSDISNASRLDSELVKEEEEEFDLVHTIREIGSYLGEQASDKGVDFITDLPADPVMIRGLEARVAQVLVNLIANAISFCGQGDAVRVWARQRENRVLVVVEDTGPGIPDQALTKIFKRFYSERPEGQFGNHSGLGLAISKQIVEAHGGVIWAENIRPTSADPTSDPLGARFVVGLPV